MSEDPTRFIVEARVGRLMHSWWVFRIVEGRPISYSREALTIAPSARPLLKNIEELQTKDANPADWFQKWTSVNTFTIESDTGHYLHYQLGPKGKWRLIKIDEKPESPNA